MAVAATISAIVWGLGSDGATTSDDAAPSAHLSPTGVAEALPSPIGTQQLPPYLPVPGRSPLPTTTRPTPVVTLGQARGTIPIPRDLITRTLTPTIGTTPAAIPTQTPERPTLQTGPRRPTPTPRRPTPTPRPAPTARPEITRPVPSGEPDPRYAVTLHRAEPEAQAWFLETLGIEWFIDGRQEVDGIPPGHKKVIYIGSLPGPSISQIREIAKKSPGSVWAVLNEPNRRLDHDVPTVLRQLHGIYRRIKAADPTAKLMSPMILNWDFTCTLCVGYQTGHSWLREFRTEYLAEYGEEPPIDIWTVNAYPLDWSDLPTVDPGIPIRQIGGLRKYLDEIPAQRDKPIWVTELSLHWGWDRIYIGREGCGDAPSPGGVYRTAEVIGYLRQVYDWLELNAESMHIERWFQYIAYRDISTCSNDGYAGLTLFDGPEPGAELTPVGRYFKRRLLGLQ